MPGLVPGISSRHARPACTRGWPGQSRPRPRPQRGRWTLFVSLRRRALAPLASRASARVDARRLRAWRRAGRAAARPGPVHIPQLGGAGRHPGQKPASEKRGTLCVETKSYVKLGSFCNFCLFRPRVPGHAPRSTGAGGAYRGIPARSPRPWSGPAVSPWPRAAPAAGRTGRRAVPATGPYRPPGRTGHRAAPATGPKRIDRPMIACFE